MHHSLVVGLHHSGAPAQVIAGKFVPMMATFFSAPGEISPLTFHCLSFEIAPLCERGTFFLDPCTRPHPLIATRPCRCLGAAMVEVSLSDLTVDVCQSLEEDEAGIEGGGGTSLIKTVLRVEEMRARVMDIDLPLDYGSLPIFDRMLADLRVTDISVISAIVSDASAQIDTIDKDSDKVIWMSQVAEEKSAPPGLPARRAEFLNLVVEAQRAKRLKGPPLSALVPSGVALFNSIALTPLGSIAESDRQGRRIQRADSECATASSFVACLLLRFLSADSVVFSAFRSLTNAVAIAGAAGTRRANQSVGAPLPFHCNVTAFSLPFRCLSLTLHCLLRSRSHGSQSSQVLPRIPKSTYQPRCFV